MGYGMFILIMPACSWLWMTLFLGISFAAVYSGKRLFHIQAEEINHYRGSLVSLTFAAWGISYGACVLAVIFAVLLSTHVIPFLSVVHSEWGIEASNAYWQVAVYMTMMAMIYILLLTPSYYYLFERRIRDKLKRKKLYWLFAASTAVLFVLIVLFGPQLM